MGVLGMEPLLVVSRTKIAALDNLTLRIIMTF